MLVLSRKSMERIQIGENVFITILEIRGKKVLIGIDAPKEISVLRSELQNVMAGFRSAPIELHSSESCPGT